MPLMTDASVGELVRGALNDARELIREEIALAKAELRQEVNKVSSATIRFGVAAVAIWWFAATFVLAVALGVSAAFNWPAWAGFGVVALLLAVTFMILVVSGRSRLRTVRPMPRTIETMKENFR
jgi:hypothetical protein